MSKEAMKLALEALELSSVTVDNFSVQKKTQEAITALREALAEQPAQRKPLTPEQVKKAMMDAKLHYCGEADLLLTKAIEAAHNIKENT